MDEKLVFWRDDTGKVVCLRDKRPHRGIELSKGKVVNLRFYQKFLPVPGLRELVAWAAMPFNRRVLHQDRRAVETHRPQPPELRISEKMIQGDRPIIEYRRRREELIEAARQEGRT